MNFSWDGQAKVVGALVEGGFSGDFLMMERNFSLFCPFLKPFKDFKNSNTLAVLSNFPSFISKYHEKALKS